MPEPSPSAPAAFVSALRARRPLLGYWSVLDSPVSTERVARLGYDYVALDAQHGLLEYQGLLSSLTAIDTRGSTAVGVVRVIANDPAPIGQALDAGATAVIVPLIDTARDAAGAVAAVRYPPLGRRSYGPMRSGLRIGPNPADAHEQTAVLAMIETESGLAHVEEICATPGLDGVYVGPSDLRIALGGATSTDPAVDAEFEAALVRVRETAAAAGIAAGIHTADGASAARRLAEGFTFASVASDLTHLEQIARHHLSAARPAGSEG
ncbi:HpcH/HpaI aldolase family protein [Streptomyces zingiberis]|uniref:4-hydroxy-2-oxovalerate aldolase n=1 Tax=Streptomyces zingiberis TaxID=2053010 RepID=A0ABX1BTX5_9ACTN|nr:aldolase/citrate lyase family protein [Streptomyces zingiberis]NJQ01170.1 4-hydroxy-2-oxovalerate aldolase [Streptomyces zingiberis]